MVDNMPYRMETARETWTTVRDARETDVAAWRQTEVLPENPAMWAGAQKRGKKNESVRARRGERRVVGSRWWAGLVG
jgi:hypothetical protein